MAYLNKDIYERKEAYASRRMLQNAENENLTPEQHDILAWICSKRHEVHTNQDDFFYSESTNSAEYWSLIDDGCGNGIIRDKLASVGLPDLKWSFNADDYMTDALCKEFGYSEEDIETEYESCIKMAGQFNNDIEQYLRAIDKQYGTDYCPSGVGRLY